MAAADSSRLLAWDSARPDKSSALCAISADTALNFSISSIASPTTARMLSCNRCTRAMTLPSTWVMGSSGSRCVRSPAAMPLSRRRRLRMGRVMPTW